MTEETKTPEEAVREPVSGYKPSVLIATPMYGGVCVGPYVNGLLKTMNKAKDLGIRIHWGYMMNESLITRARNELVRVFLENEELDYLMFIDADISFDENALFQLLVGEKDIACGVYPKKEVDWKLVEQAVKNGKEKDLRDYSGAFVLNALSPEILTDEYGMAEVRHGGTGFMLIKRDVFEKLKPLVPTYRVSATIDPETGDFRMPLTSEFFATTIDPSGVLLSEDYHFCELWRKHGGKVFAHPFIKLEHVGAYIYGGDILKSGANFK